MSLHHLHSRKRLEPYPSRSFFKRWLDRAIYAAAVGTPLALLPQVIHVHNTQDVSSLSLPTWVILSFIGILWLLYGVVHKETPIIVTHLLLLLIHLALIAAILMY